MWKLAIACLLTAIPVGSGGRGPHDVGQAPPLWPIHVESTQYPLLAASASVEGTVVVRCDIDTSGAVTEAKAQGDGPRHLVAASETNARQWRFVVPDKGNGPFAVYLEYEYRLTATSRPYDPTSNYSVDLPHRILVSTQRPPMHIFSTNDRRF